MNGLVNIIPGIKDLGAEISVMGFSKKQTTSSLLENVLKKIGQDLSNTVKKEELYTYIYIWIKFWSGTKVWPE